MVDYAAKHNRNRSPTHPGGLLREDVIPAPATRQQLYDILEERSLFPRP
jgi:hypothetical protein